MKIYVVGVKNNKNGSQLAKTSRLNFVIVISSSGGAPPLTISTPAQQDLDILLWWEDPATCHNPGLVPQEAAILSTQPITNSVALFPRDSRPHIICICIWLWVQSQVTCSP